MCIQDTRQRQAVLNMIDSCRQRTGWPIKPLGEELQAFWDDPKKPNEVLRVSVAVDDGGLRTYFPLCEDFLMKPDGSFLGEHVA